MNKILHTNLVIYLWHSINQWKNIWKTFLITWNFFLCIDDEDYHRTQHETLTNLLKELRIPAEVRVLIFALFVSFTILLM